MIRLITFLLGIMGCCSLAVANTTTHNPLTASEQQFIKDVTQQYDLTPEQVKRTLQKAHYLPSVVKKISRPYESLPYDVYRHHFLNQQRIKAGVAFLKAHHKTLALAQKQYGVDPSIITAILGVETLYGEKLGNIRVLDALTTLSFHYPPRHSFFQSELAQFLLLCQEERLSPLQLRGSYAGAFGMPQFMPSSYRHYGVDYSQDHHVDLMHNKDDVIMSVANYLAKAGWQRDEPIAAHLYPHHLPIPEALVSASGLSTASIAQLAELGFYSKEPADEQQPVAIMSLNTRHQQQEYWLTFPNFHAILRYNASPNYAMAVYELSQAIQKKYEQQQTQHS